MTRDRPWLSWTAASVWAAIALATLIGAAFISYVGSVSAPFADEWRFTNPDQYLPELFVRHTNHPFIIGRLALALDYYLFDARGWALRLASFLAIGGQVIAALLLVRAAGVRDYATQVIVAAFAATIAYNPQGHQNLVWGFQFPFSLAFSSTALALGALAAYAAQPKRSTLILAYTMGFIATQSLSSGLFAPPLMAAMAWRLGLSRRHVMGLLILTIVTWAIFLLMPASDAPTLPFLLSRTPDMLLYGFRVLGSSIATTIESVAALGGHEVDTLNIALAAGVGLVAATGAAAWIAIKEKPPSPARLGALAIALSALATGMLIGVGRHFMGQEFSLSSRYTVVGALLMLALGVFIATYATKAPRRWMQGVALASALLCTLVPMSIGVVAQRAAADQKIWVTSWSSYVVRATHLGGAPLRGIMANEDYAVAAAEDLRAHGKWLFADRWSQSMGRRVDVGDANSSVCPGTVVRRRREPGLFVVRGNVDAASAAKGRIIVVVTQNGVMKGYARISREVGDFLGLSAFQTEPREWYGFARPGQEDANGSLTAYLASEHRLICRIAEPVRLPRRI